jgi:hypothetical protein
MGKRNSGSEEGKRLLWTPKSEKVRRKGKRNSEIKVIMHGLNLGKREKRKKVTKSKN